MAEKANKARDSLVRIRLSAENGKRKSEIVVDVLGIHPNDFFTAVHFNKNFHCFLSAFEDNNKVFLLTVNIFGINYGFRVFNKFLEIFYLISFACFITHVIQLIFNVFFRWQKPSV